MSEEELNSIQELIERKILLAEVSRGLTASDKKFIDLWNYTIDLKSVLDEIREYIEHEWFKRGQLGIIDKSFQEWQLKDILQILDKVKE